MEEISGQYNIHHNSSSEIYVWGSDHHGQLGLGPKSVGKTTPLPKITSFNLIIRTISAGEDHAAFVTARGQIYTMGSNQDGRLGIANRSIKYSATPCFVESLAKFNCTSVACGWGHTMAVMDSGHTYSWGQGENGALGTGSIDNQWAPALISTPSLSGFVGVSCGARHSALVSRDGRVYMCGSGDVGQLGTGRKDRELALVCLEFSESIIQVACGIFHTLLLTSEGSVYATGGNSFGQLGIGSKKNALYPTRVKELDRLYIKKIACGHHSAALSDKGDVYLWGTGVFGEYLTPIRLTAIDAKVLDIHLGGFFGAAIDETGLVWTWGSNSSGELGVGDYEPRITPFPVVSLQGRRVNHIACGSSFIIAVGEERFSNALTSGGTVNPTSVPRAKPIVTTPKPAYSQSGIIDRDEDSEAFGEFASEKYHGNYLEKIINQKNIVQKALEKERDDRRKAEQAVSELSKRLNDLTEGPSGISELQRKLDLQTSKQEKYRQLLDDSTQRCKALEKENAEKTIRNKFVEEKLLEKERLVEENEKNIRALEEKLARTKTENEQLVFDQMKLTTDSRLHESQFKQEIDAAGSQLDELRTDLERQISMNKRLELSIQRLEDTITKKERERQQVEMQVKEIVKERESAMMALEREHEQRVEVETALNVQTSKLCESENRVLELEEEVDKLRADIMGIEVRKAEAEAIDGMQLELQELRRRLEQVLQENDVLANQLKARDRECEEIERKFRESNARLSEAFDKNQRLITILDEEIERSADEFKRKTISSLKSSEPPAITANVSRKLAPTLERVASISGTADKQSENIEQVGTAPRRESDKFETSPLHSIRPLKQTEVRRELEALPQSVATRQRQLAEIGNLDHRQKPQISADPKRMIMESANKLLELLDLGSSPQARVDIRPGQLLGSRGAPEESPTFREEELRRMMPKFSKH